MVDQSNMPVNECSEEEGIVVWIQGKGCGAEMLWSKWRRRSE